MTRIIKINTVNQSIVHAMELVAEALAAKPSLEHRLMIEEDLQRRATEAYMKELYHPAPNSLPVDRAARLKKIEHERKQCCDNVRRLRMQIAHCQQVIARSQQ